MSFVPAFGRWEDPESVERFFGTQPKLSGDALTGDDDNKDVDLTEIYKKVTGRIWNSTNQNPNGTCVGHGNAKAATLSIAMMAAAGECDWPGADVAIEPVYGGMRYEIGARKHGSNLNRGGDGGVGAWAAEWLLEYGVLLMKPYGSIDLTRYDKQRVLQWGRNGVPDELEPIAKEHPLTQAALCETAEEVWRLIGQLHPVVHCSNQGFPMSRNPDGTCRASGSWAHCAGWSGRFTLKGGRQVIRYDNSWDGDDQGNGYLGSPITVEGQNGPIHLNGCQFLVAMETVDSMCKRGGETYVFTGPKGFTKRRELFLI